MALNFLGDAKRDAKRGKPPKEISKVPLSAYYGPREANRIFTLQDIVDHVYLTFLSVSYDQSGWQCRAVPSRITPSTEDMPPVFHMTSDYLPPAK